LLDDYQNADEIADDDSNLDDPNAARKKRSEIELQIVILSSDLKKILREIVDLEAQKRKFKKEEQRIRIERDELDKNLKKLQDDQRRLEEEIGGLKKKLKILV